MTNATTPRITIHIFPSLAYFTALDHHKFPPPIWGRLGRQPRGNGQRGVRKLRNDESIMNLQESQSFIRKMLGDTVGFIVFALIFATYFPVFIAWFLSNAISMGIYSMLTNDEPSKNRGGLWWIFPAIPTAVLIVGAIAWTVVLGSTLVGALSK
jgi:hypothetical protein